MYAPVPSGNWTKELSCQILSTIGYYGLWNYYLHTGDKQTLADLYDGVKKYMGIWETEDNGLVRFRSGEWQWGDWGGNIDIVLIHNILYYHAVKGMYHSANVLNKQTDAKDYQAWMDKFKQAFNEKYWTGSAYRHTDYKGKNDDRVQALATVIGLADEDKYPAILETLKKEHHASPYMERYVLQALFHMQYADYGLERLRTRYHKDINDDRYTTIPEIWNMQGTVNHAWSGGGLNVLAAYLCGVAPVEAAYKTFRIIPQPGDVAGASLTLSTVAGTISTAYNKQTESFTLDAVVPDSTECIIGIESGYSTISLNGKTIWEKGKFKNQTNAIPVDDTDKKHIKFQVSNGTWNVKASK